MVNYKGYRPAKYETFKQKITTGLIYDKQKTKSKYGRHQTMTATETQAPDYREEHIDYGAVKHVCRNHDKFILNRITMQPRRVNVRIVMLIK